MRRIGLAILGAAMLAGGAPAWAQSEMEQYQQTGDKLLNQSRENVAENYQIAARALRNKDYATARKYAQSVTRASPKDVEPWLVLGGAQLGLQDWKRARVTFATALRLGPDNAEARTGMGIAMAMTKDARAQEQLAWLTSQAQACGPGCSRGPELAKFKGQVEAAMAEAAKGS